LHWQYAWIAAKSLVAIPITQRLYSPMNRKPDLQ